MDHINAMATKRARHERHKERDRKPAKRVVSTGCEFLWVVASGHAVWDIQYCPHPLSRPTATPTKTVETVKVMYTLDRDDTPYRITVPHW